MTFEGGRLPVRANSAPASLRPPRWVSFTVKDPKTCDFTSGNKNTREHVSAKVLRCRNVTLLLRLRGRARLGEGACPALQVRGGF